MSNTKEIIETEAEVLPQEQSAGLLETNTDNILMMAEKADKYLEGLNKIMTAALKITSEFD